MAINDCYVSCEIQESLDSVWGSQELLDSSYDKKGIIQTSIKAFLGFLSDGLTWNRSENEKIDTKIC